MMKEENVNEQVGQNFQPEGNIKKEIKEGDDPKTGRKRSFVWEHFKRLEEDQNVAKCIWCGKTYAANSRYNGTSTMRTHLETRCPKYPGRVPPEDKKRKGMAWESKDGKNEDGVAIGAVKASSFDPTAARSKLVKMILIDELPFNIVENEGFRELMHALEPQFVVPSMMTIARDIMRLYIDERKKLMKMMRSHRICLTIDTWTSIQNTDYIRLTAHWIDENWVLVKKTLNFIQVPDHRGETLGKLVEQCLLDWKIGRILTITIDNASSDDTTIKYLSRRIRGGILNNEFLHMKCCAHIINLIVKEGLEEQRESTIKIRNAVRYVRSSPSRLAMFKKSVKSARLESKSLICLDVESRWDSTYLMLEAAERFEEAFDFLVEDDDKFCCYFMTDEAEDDLGEKGERYIGPPRSDDWINARCFIKFLSLFYHVTLKFSGSSYTTSNLFFSELVQLQTKIKSITRSLNTSLRLMAIRMQDKFNKYWEDIDKLNHLVYIASILDPCSKMRFVKFCLDIVYDHDTQLVEAMVVKVLNSLTRLFEEYCLKNSGAAKTSSPNASSQVEIGEDVDMFKLFDRHLDEEESIDNKSELARYLNETNVKRTTNFDVLKWWKENSCKYPILSLMAKDILAIPICTMDAAFSTSSHILDPFQSSLGPCMVQALVCCQSWVKTSCANIKDYMDTAETYDEIAEEFMPSNSSEGGNNQW